MGTDRAKESSHGAPFGLALLGFIAFLGGAVEGRGADSRSPGIVSASISKPVFFQELQGALQHIAEFRFIRQEADRLGIKVYLFGGTAASLGHYIRGRIQREGSGVTGRDPGFDFTEIYRSTQDLDLVVDGSPEKAMALRAALIKAFPAAREEVPAWEVRLLRERAGAKEALLDNPSFLDQHTDSSSVGLIEVSECKSHREVRDLRSWGSQDSEFLQDILAGKIRYYFSARHGETERAKRRLNPPIISAIRYLIKVFQFELGTRPQDEEAIRRVIADFDPERLGELEPYVKDWIERNGKKLYLHARNVEHAQRKLEELGLKEKLIRVSGNVDQVGSLAWWMNRESLPQLKVGQGVGKTAAELGIGRVAHETKTIQSYESISHSPSGYPNVFQSRRGVAGEAAEYGAGFYTAIGDQGATGSRINIRFEVNPQAREGHDFTVVPTGVLFHNKAALKIIPESLVSDPVDYFRQLAQGVRTPKDNIALVDRFERRLAGQLAMLGEGESKEIGEIVRSAVERLRVQLSGSRSMQRYIQYNVTAVLSAWLKIPSEFRDPTVLAKIRADLRSVIRLKMDYVNEELVRGVLRLTELAGGTDLLGLAISSSSGGSQVSRAICEEVLAKEDPAAHPDLVSKLIAMGDVETLQALVDNVFSRPGSEKMGDLFTRLIQVSDLETLELIASRVFSQDHAIPMVSQLRLLVSRMRGESEAYTDLILNYFAKPAAIVQEEIVLEIAKRGSYGDLVAIIENVLSNPRTPEMPTLVDYLVKQHFLSPGPGASTSLGGYLAKSYFTLPSSLGAEKQLRSLVERGSPGLLEILAVHAFSQPHWAKNGLLVRRLIERADSSRVLARINEHVFTSAYEGDGVFREAAKISDPSQRKDFLKKQLGPKSRKPAACLLEKLTTRR